MTTRAQAALARHFGTSSASTPRPGAVAHRPSSRANSALAKAFGELPGAGTPQPSREGRRVAAPPLARQAVAEVQRTKLHVSDDMANTVREFAPKQAGLARATTPPAAPKVAPAKVDGGITSINQPPSPEVQAAVAAAEARRNAAAVARYRK